MTRFKDTSPIKGRIVDTSPVKEVTPEIMEKVEKVFGKSVASTSGMNVFEVRDLMARKLQERAQEKSGQSE